MGIFEYDPAQRFRGWLRTITCHALSDFLEARRRPGLDSGHDRVA
jgi:hypothetical protein